MIKPNMKSWLEALNPHSKSGKIILSFSNAKILINSPHLPISPSILTENETALPCKGGKTTNNRAVLTPAPW